MLCVLVVVFLGWFAALATEWLPDWIRRFLVAYMRSVTRVNAYTYLLVDEYPPFAFTASNTRSSQQPGQPQQGPRQQRELARLLDDRRMAQREPEPTAYWLSSLPTDTPVRELVQLAKMRWRIEQDYRELKDGLRLTTSKAAAWPAGPATSPHQT